jgi:hypothetical protein
LVGYPVGPMAHGLAGRSFIQGSQGQTPG